MGPGADGAAWPPTIEGINVWLRGPEGRTLVRHALDRYRLPPALADDLAQEVLYRAWRAIGRGEAIVSVPAFATALITRAAVDLLRGGRRREEPLGHPGTPSGHPAGAEALAGAGAAGDTVSVAVDPPVADGMRRSVQGLLGPEPAAGAAALAYVTLVAGDVPPPSGCPAPEGDADPGERLAWAALWCTGRDDCFETEPGEPRREPAAGQAAVRARRSRALHAMRALLARAADGLPDDDRA